jgi:hypothetical protein
MSEVHRFTTKYNPAEDRIQLLLELKDGNVQVLWLTRSLLNLLLPRLLGLLDQAPQISEPTAGPPSPQKAKVVQKFAQQAAVSTIQRQPSVAPSDKTPQRGVAVLVTEVDLRTAPKSLALDFKSGAHKLQSLPFSEGALRQWLSVVHKQYGLGQWQENFWPEWMTSTENADAVKHLN